MKVSELETDIRSANKSKTFSKGDVWETKQKNGSLGGGHWQGKGCKHPPPDLHVTLMSSISHSTHPHFDHINLPLVRNLSDSVWFSIWSTNQHHLQTIQRHTHTFYAWLPRTPPLQTCCQTNSMSPFITSPAGPLFGDFIWTQYAHLISLPNRTLPGVPHPHPTLYTCQPCCFKASFPQVCAESDGGIRD